MGRLGNFRDEAHRRAVVAKRKRAALRAHWLDVAIVVLTIPLLGKALAWIRAGVEKDATTRWGRAASGSDPGDDQHSSRPRR